MGQRNHILDGSTSPMGRGNFEGEEAAHCKFREYRLCAAAMQPFIKLLWSLVILLLLLLLHEVHKDCDILGFRTVSVLM